MDHNFFFITVFISVRCCCWWPLTMDSDCSMPTVSDNSVGRLKDLLKRESKRHREKGKSRKISLILISLYSLQFSSASHKNHSFQFSLHPLEAKSQGEMKFIFYHFDTLTQLPSWTEPPPPGRVELIGGRDFVGGGSDPFRNYVEINGLYDEHPGADWLTDYRILIHRPTHIDWPHDDSTDKVISMGPSWLEMTRHDPGNYIFLLTLPPTCGNFLGEIGC